MFVYSNEPSKIWWHYNEGQTNNYTISFAEADSRLAAGNDVGIEKTLLLMRQPVYWINMNADIKETVKQCVTCLEYQCKQPQERALQYDIPYKPWEVVGANIFMVNDKILLHIVDYYSKFQVVKKWQVFQHMTYCR